MSRPRSIYVICDLLFIFSLIFAIMNHIISVKQTKKFFCIFFRISPINFGMIMLMKKANNFQIVNVQPQGVAQLLLDILTISAWCWL